MRRAELRSGTMQIGPALSNGADFGAKRGPLGLFAGQRAQTARADVDALPLSVDQDPLALDIGTENAIRCYLGVAHVVTKSRTLATNITFCHSSPLASH